MIETLRPPVPRVGRLYLAEQLGRLLDDVLELGRRRLLRLACLEDHRALRIEGLLDEAGLLGGLYVRRQTCTQM